LQRPTVAAAIAAEHLQGIRRAAGADRDSESCMARAHRLNAAPIVVGRDGHAASWRVECYERLMMATKLRSCSTIAGSFAVQRWNARVVLAGLRKSWKD